MINIGNVLEGNEAGCLISHQSEGSFDEIYEKTKKRLEESSMITKECFRQLSQKSFR